MSGQKHTLFIVPNYDQTGSSGDGSPLSYLRLGSVESDSETLTSDALRGDDLLALVGLTAGADDFFQDDRRASHTGGALPSIADALDGGTTLADAGTSYYRQDSPAAPSESDRSTLNEQLRGDGQNVLARGGWRDHTDGNRIVTVRGDRVDVVVGNYKRVVLGRVAESSVYGDDDADPLKQTSWEVSGGHIFGKGSTGVQSVKSIEWVKESSDVDPSQTPRWKAVEKTAKGDTVTRYSGMIEEYYNGPWMQTQIGVGSGGSDKDQKNPEIIDETWAKKEDSAVEADEVVDDTTVHTLIEIDDSEGATLDTRIIAPIYDVTTGKPSQYIDTFNEELWVVNSHALELYGFALNFEAATQVYGGAGNAVSVSLGQSQWSFSFGADISLYLGGQVGMSFSAKEAVEIAASIEINVLAFELTLSKSSFSMLKSEISALTASADASDDELTSAGKTTTAFKNQT